MSSVTIVEAKAKFPREIEIRSREEDILSYGTADEVTTLCIDAEDQGVGLRLAELWINIDGDGNAIDGTNLRFRGQVADRLETIEPHSARTALRTSELIAGAMAITDSKLNTKALDEIESHAKAHSIKEHAYTIAVFPAGVLIYPTMPFRLLEMSISDHGTLYPSDIDRAFRIIRHQGSSSHSFLRTAGLIDRYLSALVRSPISAQVRRDLPRGVNASLLDTKFVVK